MPSTFPIAPALLLVLVALTGCGAAPNAAIRPATTNSPHLAIDDFPGAARLLVGFDDVDSSADWNQQDRVLFALQLRKGETVTRWLLHLEVLVGDLLSIRLGDDAPNAVQWGSNRTWTYATTVDGVRQEHRLTSRLRPVIVRVHDEAGKQLGNSLVQLPADLLGTGLLPGIDAARVLYATAETDAPGATPAAAPGQHLPRQEQERHVLAMVRSTLALMALLSIVQEDSVLADYFWQVIEKPSVWSVLSSFGVTASLVTALEQSVPATSLPPGLPDLGPTFVAPMRVEVNGSPALLADIVATQSARPYALCGGIVAATARHPSRPELQFDVQLLAARVGTTTAKATGTVKTN